MTVILPDLHDGDLANPALDLLLDPNEVSTPTTEVLRWLLGKGVAIEAIAAAADGRGRMHWAIGAARVCFQPDGYYTPAVTGDFAFIIAAQTSAGVADLVAWQPATGRLATRLGLAGLLGQRCAEEVRDEITPGPVRVWRTPLAWLRAGRDGVVIVDPELAAHLLSDLPVVPEDIEFGHALMALRLPPPRLIFSASGRIAP
jgi:hypothetical protein